MGRSEAIRAIAEARLRCDAALFVSNGELARTVFGEVDDAKTFYLFGGMSLCVPLAAGFARQRRSPVIALEGDGNFVMGLSGALVPGEFAVSKFVHIVLDNGVYETTGRQKRPSQSFDFCAHARNAGYDEARTVSDSRELAERITSGLADGRHFIRCPVDVSGERPSRPVNTGSFFAARLRVEISKRIENETGSV